MYLEYCLKFLIPCSLKVCPTIMLKHVRVRTFVGFAFWFFLGIFYLFCFVSKFQFLPLVVTEASEERVKFYVMFSKLFIRVRSYYIYLLVV